MHVRANVAVALLGAFDDRVELGEQRLGVEHLWRSGLDGRWKEVHISLDTRLGRGRRAVKDHDAGRCRQPDRFVGLADRPVPVAPNGEIRGFVRRDGNVGAYGPAGAVQCQPVAIIVGGTLHHEAHVGQDFKTGITFLDRQFPHSD